MLGAYMNRWIHRIPRAVYLTIGAICIIAPNINTHILRTTGINGLFIAATTLLVLMMIMLMHACLDMPGDDTHSSQDTPSSHQRGYHHTPPQQPSMPRHVCQAYATLGLMPTASMDECTRAYRTLARLHHPDRHTNTTAALQHSHSEQMVRLNTAMHTIRTIHT